MSSATFAEKLQEDGIIPDVLPQELVPTAGATLKVIYPSAVVYDGQILERVQVLQEPKLELTGGDDSKLYTLIMTDPDLFKTNDQISGQVRHWLQPGIKFDGTTHLGSYNQQALTSYLPSSPSLGTGKHRYVFILCEQPSAANLEQGPLTAGGSTADLKDRMGFNAGQYIQAAGLKVAAIAWMKVKPDVSATLTDVKAMAESAVHKVQGK